MPDPTFAAAPSLSARTLPGEADALAVGLIERSRLAHVGGQHLEGAALAAQAVLASAAATDPALAAQAQALLAAHQWRLGQFEAAVVAGVDAAARWAPLGGGRECENLCLLAIAYSELGLQDEALQAATTAFDKARAQGLDAQAAQALNRIGVCYDRLGDPAQSEKFLLQSLGHARQLGGHDDVLAALNNLMATGISAFYHHRQRNEPEQAQAALQRARQHGRQSVLLARRHADTYRLVVTQGNFGEVLGLAGEYEKSQRVLLETVQHAQQHGYRAVELRTRHNIGEILILQGRPEAAIAELQATLNALRSSDQETTRVRVHSALYRACKAARQFEAALHHCEVYHALELHRAGLQKEAQARLMVNRVEVESALRDGQRAQIDADVQRQRSMALEADNRQLEARTAELQRNTLEDQLTQLGNRRRVDEELPHIVARARESGLPLCVAVADLDHFKGVNDRFGHGVGDNVLRAVSHLFRVKTRSSDLLARTGGEEFLFVFVDTPLDTARDICERLRASIANHAWNEVAPGLAVTLSLGLCRARLEGSAQDLIDCADAALYAAKRAGRNRVSIGGE